jgi:hypothetical protein
MGDEKNKMDRQNLGNEITEFTSNSPGDQTSPDDKIFLDVEK